MSLAILTQYCCAKIDYPVMTPLTTIQVELSILEGMKIYAVNALVIFLFIFPKEFYLNLWSEPELENIKMFISEQMNSRKSSVDAF